MTSLSTLPFLLSGVLLLASCSSNDDGDDVRPNGNTSGGDVVRVPTDRYRSADCATVATKAIVGAGLFGTPADAVECGFVTVPSDWATPAGQTLEIAVYRIPSTATSPAADPVVYLEGGPGGAGIATLGSFVSGGDASYLRERGDVVVIDQRGTGYSRPSLYCPEVSKAKTEKTDVIAAFAACRDRLVTAGTNLADFNSANNARDVDAVREALGYKTWNLYGLSYGTRLALTAMRDQPAPLESVVLDSVFPPEINGIAEGAYPVFFALEQISINCAADADCNAALPNMKQLIEKGIARLDANPIKSDERTFGAPDYAQFLTQSIANENLPELITTVANADDSRVAALLGEILGGGEGSEQGGSADEGLPPYHTQDEKLWPVLAEVAEMMYSAVVCQEETPFPNDVASPKIAGNFTETTQRIIDKAGRDEETIAVCNMLALPAADRLEVQPVTAATPTLVLAGTADVATPPAWSMLAAESLPNAQYAEFAGLTHGLLGNNKCLNDMTRAFLDAPTATVNQACIVDLPGVDYKVQ